MKVDYIIDERTKRVGLQIIPKSLARKVVQHRDVLEGPGNHQHPAPAPTVQAWQVDSLVQVALAGEKRPDGFSQGRTLRNSPVTRELQFVRQRAGKNQVVTVLKSKCGFRCEHRLSWRDGTRTLSLSTKFINTSEKPLTLEMLSSFSLGRMTPFHVADAPERLRVHRFRSSWSAEGRLDTRTLEELQLEPSWIGYGVSCERFGQVGSMPVRGWFPFAAIEDTAAGVTWAAQLAWLGSWQMEIYRRDDFVNLSGGLAGRELGHWMKTIRPGEAFETPEAFLTVVQGDLDAACERLTASHLVPARKAETELPIVFNEWCSSWGAPTHDNLIALADRLRGSEVRYLVIDDGWAERPGRAFQQNGDWIVNRAAFPHGLRATADAIRARGLIPGIWFEFEAVNEGAKAFAEATHQLHRDGKLIQVGNRCFWDFRDPWVHEFLEERVTKLLRENNLGYLKVDYNDTIGLGVDGAESPGEGLRAHLEGVQRFFKRIQSELPELVIENCSSGGHREEPSMLALTSMTSFSDAHETREIPIIAANLQRLIRPGQSQVWAVLRSGDDDRRLTYSLAATFLGRMCLSGDIASLSRWQWERTLEAQRLYRKIWRIIQDGVSHRSGPQVGSYRHPHGWQGILRVARNGREALAVIHSFASPIPATAEIELPALPKAGWKIAADFHTGNKSAVIRHGKINIPMDGQFSGRVIYLKK